ncbi:MAG: hypothetical protein JHC37_01035 [Campylobacteraceae bacterium]|nr:hypothetical protein [Campylobacteraceae bacterium]
MKKTIRYKKGVLEGEAEFYHPNGFLKERSAYKNCFENGLWREFSEDGKLASRGEYKDGKR